MKKPLIILLSLLALTESAWLYAETETNPDELLVYRTSTCGCCGKWLDHVKDQHFKVKSIVNDDLQAIKERLGVPDKLASCHTAVINGYVIEGHVPADDIKKLLKTKPKVIGIAAPGMPMGSPGMENGDFKQHYQVISFDKAGHQQVFSEHEGNQ